MDHKGKKRGRPRREVFDLVDAGEADASEDEGMEDEDQVTETKVKDSDPGKQPVFHYEIFDRLVNLMRKQGTYTNEPADYGVNDKDITSFHPDQRDWSSSRAHRAPILTLWSKPPRSVLMHSIGYLLFNGRLIQDWSGEPIKAFPQLPLTISSEVKGFRIETWIRQGIYALSVNDILARMRSHITGKGREPLRQNAELTRRATVFRFKSGLLPFSQRNDAAENATRDYLDSLRTPEQRANNRAIDRDLTAAELAHLKDIRSRKSRNAIPGSQAHRIPAKVPAPTISIGPTSSSARPRPPLPPLQPALATLPTPAPTTKLSDSRNAIPKTTTDYYGLQAALADTVAHFKKLTHYTIPKPTKSDESYNTQYNALQEQFEPIWKALYPKEVIPRLFKLGKWTGGICCWDRDWRTLAGDAWEREGRAVGEVRDASQERTANLGPENGEDYEEDFEEESYNEDSADEFDEEAD